MGVGEEVAPDLDAGVYDDVSEDSSVCADSHPRADDGVGTDVRTLGDLGRGIDDSGWMDSGRICRRRVEEPKRAGEGMIGIAYAHRGSVDLLEVGFDDDRGSVGSACE